MTKRISAKFRPSPAMIVALLGVALGLGSSGWAANGGAFILGVFNSATLRSALVANVNDSALQVSNTSVAASAVPLLLTAAAGHPPMKINTATKVTNLNADYVDGLDAGTQLTRVMRIPFNLAAGAESAPIALPANLPISIMATVIGDFHGSTNLDGVSQLTIRSFHDTSIAWVGVDLAGTIVTGNVTAAIAQTGVLIEKFSQFDSSRPGTPAYLRTDGANAIRIHSAQDPIHGTITLVW